MPYYTVVYDGGAPLFLEYVYSCHLIFVAFSIAATRQFETADRPKA